MSQSSIFASERSDSPDFNRAIRLVTAPKVEGKLTPQARNKVIAGLSTSVITTFLGPAQPAIEPMVVFTVDDRRVMVRMKVNQCEAIDSLTWKANNFSEGAWREGVQNALAMALTAYDAKDWSKQWLVRPSGQVVITLARH